MFSGLYRRSWTSLPTSFISAQRLSERTVSRIRQTSAQGASERYHRADKCVLLPDEGEKVGGPILQMWR
jgi:hypothetical protein